MNRSQIERAEKIAEKLERRRRREDLKLDAKQWRRPRSLAEDKPKRPPRAYEFTEAQMLIAIRALERRGE